MIFKNRNEAGKLLAEKLKKYARKKPIILAIPRGGVVIGYEIAKSLNAKLDVLILKKIGSPQNPELALGAVCQDGSVFLNEGVMRQLGVGDACIQEEKQRLMKEIQERKKRYGVEEVDLAGKIAILVDDGMATGATMLTAVRYAKKQKAKKVVVAVPVSSSEAVDMLGNDVEVVSLYTTDFLVAIGEFYQNFEQVEDEEVAAILKKRSY